MFRNLAFFFLISACPLFADTISTTPIIVNFPVPTGQQMYMHDDAPSIDVPFTGDGFSTTLASAGDLTYFSAPWRNLAAHIEDIAFDNTWGTADPGVTLKIRVPARFDSVGFWDGPEVTLSGTPQVVLDTSVSSSTSSYKDFGRSLYYSIDLPLTVQSGEWKFLISFTQIDPA